MDRLTTGRRHVRAGSVHVTELISRQAPAPTGAATALATRPRPVAESPVDVDTVDTAVGALEPVDSTPGSHRRPASKGAQFAKLTSLGAATLVLCGAVAVASMISHERADEQRAAERPAIRITGDQALLPDRLDRTLPSSGAAAPPPAERRSTEAPAPRVPERTVEQSAAPPAAPAGTPRETTTPTTAQLSNVALVTKFYDSLPSDPDAAFDLISPNLLSTTLGEFLDSWSTVRGIHLVDVREQAEGVLAVVRMTLADGSHLRIEQLLTVADSPRRITGVQLLSAQRN